jgi:hypothetical protein
MRRGAHVGAGEIHVGSGETHVVVEMRPAMRDTPNLQENINSPFTPEPQFCCGTARIRIKLARIAP